MGARMRADAYVFILSLCGGSFMLGQYVAELPKEPTCNRATVLAEYVYKDRLECLYKDRTSVKKVRTTHPRPRSKS